MKNTYEKLNEMYI